MLRPYKYISMSAVFALAFACQVGAVKAATFSYHGTLRESGKPAEGNYDLELTLYSAANGGSAIAGPVTLYKVPVHGSGFSVEADLGPLANNTGDAWLGVRVRSAGTGEFVALSARSLISPSALASVCPGAWTLSGNAGNPPGSFLGTADNQPLVLEMNAKQVAKFANASGLYNNTTAVTGTNVLIGDPTNSIAAGTVGATVSGGGTYGVNDFPQAVGADAHWSTIAGGISNSAGGYASTVCGGDNNVAGFGEATVAGGSQNDADNNYATVGGGFKSRASGNSSTISGGNTNTAIGEGAAVGGGYNNYVIGRYATVAGGQNNSAGGDFSFAGGFGATVNDSPGCTPIGNTVCGDYGTFVWSDAQGAPSFNPFSSTGTNQFLVLAAGGIGLNTNAPAPKKLTVAGPAGAITSGFTSSARTIALFENNDSGYIETLVPATLQAGLMFSLVGAVSDGGIYYNNSANANGLSFRTNGNIDRMRITSTGATQNKTGAWSTFSDARLKTHIAMIEHPLETLLGLHGQYFEYIDPEAAMAQAGRRMGFIAQDVEKVLPQWVAEDERGYKMVTPTGFEALSVEALRELRAEKDAEISALQGKLDDLTARLSRLEARAGE